MVNRALAAHTCEVKASVGWTELPARRVARCFARTSRSCTPIRMRPLLPTRRDSAYQLSVLEEDAGDEQAARLAIRAAVEFAQMQARRWQHASSTTRRTRIIGTRSGNESAAFEE